MLSDSVANELQSLPDLLNQLEPKEKIDAIIKLLPYLIPKIQSQSIEEQEKNEPLTERIERLHSHLQEENKKRSNILILILLVIQKVHL